MPARSIWNKIYEPELLLAERNVDIAFITESWVSDNDEKRLLFRIIQYYGIQGDLSMWIASFLNERTQQVRVGDQLSRISNVLSGVPQGTVLGPILFNIFVDDIDNWFSKSIVLKYADDIKIMKYLDKIDFAADSSLLQADLNFAAVWAENWKLPLLLHRCLINGVSTINSYLMSKAPVWWGFRHSRMGEILWPGSTRKMDDGDILPAWNAGKYAGK